MTNTLYRGRERAILSKLVLEIIKIAHGTKLGSTVQSPNMYGVFFILADVLIGHEMGKPRTASQVSRNLGIPRVTAQRKLSQLVKAGAVLRHGKTAYVLAPSAPGEVSDRHIDRAMAAVRRAAEG
jgi:hypothetical protein